MNLHTQTANAICLSQGLPSMPEWVTPALFVVGALTVVVVWREWRHHQDRKLRDRERQEHEQALAETRGQVDALSGMVEAVTQVATDLAAHLEDRELVAEIFARADRMTIGEPLKPPPERRRKGGHLRGLPAVAGLVGAGAFLWQNKAKVALAAAGVGLVTWPFMGQPSRPPEALEPLPPRITEGPATSQSSPPTPPDVLTPPPTGGTLPPFSPDQPPPPSETAPANPPSPTTTGGGGAIREPGSQLVGADMPVPAPGTPEPQPPGDEEPPPEEPPGPDKEPPPPREPPGEPPPPDEPPKEPPDDEPDDDEDEKDNALCVPPDGVELPEHVEICIDLDEKS